MKRLLSLAVIEVLITVSIAPAGVLRVACIGNSITEGATLPKPSEQAYPALLDTLLGPAYDVNNYGVGGRVMLKNGDYPIWNEVAFTRAIEFDPDIVTILLGTNDSKPWNWESFKDEYVPDYIDMIRTFRALDNNVRFLLGYPPPAFSNLGSIRDSVIHNEIIPLIDSVSAETGTQIVDFYNPMINDSDLFPDGIHPNAAGHEKMADIFKSAIEALPAVVDTLPTWFTKVPAGTITVYDSAAALIEVRTAGTATVRYSATDQSYELMENTFSHTGGRDHRTIIRGTHGQTYTYYLRAMDTAGNVTDTSATVSFTFDTTKVLYNWTEAGYPDSTWKSGPALFGNSQVTGPISVLNDAHAAYFRKSFSVTDAGSVVGIGLLVKGQSGAIVYLNSHEIERINMPSDEVVPYEASAEQAAVLNKMVVINADNGLKYLKNGENIVGIEMHVSEGANPALSFDAQLIDNTNKIYFALGSEWTWYDEGRRPEDQLIEKGTQTVVVCNTTQPVDFVLFQNYPNPFNPLTTIRYQLPLRQNVQLNVYDITGACVRELVNGMQESGAYTVYFDGSGLASGIYFYRLHADSQTQTRSMLLMK